MTVDGTVIGFTGTVQPRAFTAAQAARLHDLLGTAKAATIEATGDDDPPLWFLHGAQVGADSAAHWIALALGYKVSVYPTDIDYQSALPRVRDTCDRVYRPMVPPDPGKAIVDQVAAAIEQRVGCSMMIAMPGTDFPDRFRVAGVAKVATWRTVDYALMAKVTTSVTPPDGVTTFPALGHLYGEPG